MTEFWSQLRRACESIDPGAALITPVSDRLFDIDATRTDRIDIQFRESGEERSLRRNQFEVLVDQLERSPLSLEELPPRVEPYVTILSLSPDYTASEDSLTRGDGDSTAESRFLVGPQEARSKPEQIHDDAILLADLLDRLDDSPTESLDTETLTDLYVLLSDVQWGADEFRREVSKTLLERLGPDQRLPGRYGTVSHTTRQRRQPRDDETVLAALDEHGIPHEWVLGVDPDKLDVVLAVTDLSEDEVYDVENQVYVQKTDVEEGEKYSRLQGLADRLAEVEGGEGLAEDLADLERRIDEELSTG